MQRLALLESIITSAPYGIVVAKREGTLLLANSLGRAYLRLPEGEGYPISPYLEAIPGLAEQLAFPLKEPVAGFDLLAVKTSQYYLTIRGRLVEQGLALSIIDVTRAKKTEQHMLDAILEASEAQRRKLSKEIHDGIGPLISTIKLNLDALQLELGEEPPPRAAQMIESMSELLKAMSNDIRSISHNLMPNVLVDFGQVAAGGGFPVEHLAGDEDAGAGAQHQVGVERFEAYAAGAADGLVERARGEEAQRQGLDGRGEAGGVVEPGLVHAFAQ